MSRYSDPYSKDTLAKFIQRKEVWKPLINAVAKVHSVHSPEYKHIRTIQHALENFIIMNPEHFVKHKELNMTQENNATKGQHPHADILRAIADGKTIQWKYDKSEDKDSYVWEDLQPTHALACLSQYGGRNNYHFRVKPETITGWIRIYSNAGAHFPVEFIHKFREDALKGFEEDMGNKKYTPVACIQITYTPGEGL